MKPAIPTTPFTFEIAFLHSGRLHQASLICPHFLARKDTSDVRWKPPGDAEVSEEELQRLVLLCFCTSVVACVLQLALETALEISQKTIAAT